MGTSRSSCASRRAFIADARACGAAIPFSPVEAAAIVERLAAIEWKKTLRDRDPARGEGAERYETICLPLTRHDAWATLWVYDFERLRFDHARHVYADRPDQLPEPVRAHYEARWSTMARHEMAGTGHVPFRFVHRFDEREEVMLLELPTSDLLGWMWGDVDDLVLTMRKADRAAGAWDRVTMQVSN